jgi:hypothetical protein
MEVGTPDTEAESLLEYANGNVDHAHTNYLCWVLLIIWPQFWCGWLGVTLSGALPYGLYMISFIATWLLIVWIMWGLDRRLQDAKDALLWREIDIPMSSTRSSTPLHDHSLQ